MKGRVVRGVVIIGKVVRLGVGVADVVVFVVVIVGAVDVKGIGARRRALDEVRRTRRWADVRNPDRCRRESEKDNKGDEHDNDDDEGCVETDEAGNGDEEIMSTGDGAGRGRALHRRGCVSGIRARDQPEETSCRWKQARIQASGFQKFSRARHPPELKLSSPPIAGEASSE